MSSINFLGFNDHSKLRGFHAFMGASKYHWINYDQEKLLRYYENYQAAERGTRLHEFAKDCIELNQKLPHSTKTLNMYVNDAIGFKMKPEVVLFYSEYCFGTVDAIGFDGNKLRIHDYKSGETKAHMEQLRIYAALFCLEYKINPFDIEIELRIYQNDEIIYENSDQNVIKYICDKIVENDILIRNTYARKGV